MKKVIIALSVIALSNVAQAQTQPETATTSTTHRLACPAGYAIDVGTPPPPPDDPATPDAYQPKTSAEKQQEQEQKAADELARWHCVPIDPRNPPQQDQQQGQ